MSDSRDARRLPLVSVSLWLPVLQLYPLPPDGRKEGCEGVQSDMRKRLYERVYVSACLWEFCMTMSMRVFNCR